MPPSRARESAAKPLHRIPPVAAANPGVLQHFSFAILIAFLFMIFSRIFDIHLSRLHLPGISYRVMGIFLVITGAFLTAFRDKIGKCVLGFTACFMIAIPFSFWKGGSLHSLINEWLMPFVVFVATASLISDFRQYVLTAKTIALAILVLTIFCITLGVSENGRLFLERGRFSNPNEMAQALLLGMPFWWALLSNFRSLVAKLFGVSSLGLMLYVIGKTGSRGALISLAVMLCLMFVRATTVGKVKLLVSTALLFTLALLLLPGGLKARYETLLSSEEIENRGLPQSGEDAAANSSMLESAVSSTAGRKEMLIRSLVLTIKHPLVGVGPGQFMVAEDAMARAEGKRRGAWLGTHNSFTQVSSECGIPALLFYVGIVVFSFQGSYSLYRRAKIVPGLKEVSDHALALNYSLLVFVVTGMFVHAPYTALLPVLAGLAVSLMRTSAQMVPAASSRVMPAAGNTPRPYRPARPGFSPARSL
ncbi:MAG: O-antigen ligase family protein [Acidobacteriia bacterium]|nr:O-antigen ligase family protein [Terriglobia bacterium]